MKFKGPWSPLARVAQLLLNGCLIKCIFFMDNNRISLAPAGRSSCPHCLFKYHPGKIPIFFSLSSLQDLKLSVGQLEAHVYTWLSRVASLQHSEILFRRALCCIPPRAFPTPTLPPPLMGVFP